MNVVVVVQARLGSSRLPGKVMLPLAGAPLLQRLLERVLSTRPPFELVVATTTDPADDPIVDLARGMSVACHRGHPTDLLDRHYRAAAALEADAVVKIPSDCPLIAPEVIERVLGFYLDHADELDYVSNLHPATYPDGNDVEVFSRSALETAWREASQAHEREHTTPFLWDRPERFRLGNVAWESGADLSQTHRFTVDYPADYLLVSAVYDGLWRAQGPPFGLDEILRFLERHPETRDLNARYVGVNWYRHHLAELRTVGPRDTRLPDEERAEGITP